MPDEWQNVVKEGKDGYLKFDYTTCVPILWSAVQTTINDVERLKKEVNKLNKIQSDSDDAFASSGRSRDGERSPSGRSRDDVLASSGRSRDGERSSPSGRSRD